DPFQLDGRWRERHIGDQQLLGPFADHHLDLGSHPDERDTQDVTAAAAGEEDHVTAVGAGQHRTGYLGLDRDRLDPRAYDRGSIDTYDPTGQYIRLLRGRGAGEADEEEREEQPQPRPVHRDSANRIWAGGGRSGMMAGPECRPALQLNRTPGEVEALPHTARS